MSVGDRGVADGCVNLGNAHIRGEGARADEGEALKFYGKACDLQNSNGCNYYRLLKKGKLQ